jgi:hypothetical protein
VWKIQGSRGNVGPSVRDFSCAVKDLGLVAVYPVFKLALLGQDCLNIVAPGPQRDLLKLEGNWQTAVKNPCRKGSHTRDGQNGEFGRAVQVKRATLAQNTYCRKKMLINYEAGMYTKTNKKMIICPRTKATFLHK